MEGVGNDSVSSADSQQEFTPERPPIASLIAVAEDDIANRHVPLEETIAKDMTEYPGLNAFISDQMKKALISEEARLIGESALVVYHVTKILPPGEEFVRFKASEGKAYTEARMAVEEDYIAERREDKNSIYLMLQEDLVEHPELAAFIAQKMSESVTLEEANLIGETSLVVYNLLRALRPQTNKPAETLLEKPQKLHEHRIVASRVELPKNWTYSHLREYMLALTRGKDFVLPREQFPEEMHLSNHWHGVLNKMRQDTSVDETERWAGIGFKLQSRGIYLPSFPVLGEHEYVPSEVIQRELDRMKNEAGMDDIIGDIHSHPRKLPQNTWTRLLSSSKTQEGAFSAGDLYRAVDKRRPLPIIGVVDGPENILAFRTRESASQDVDSLIMDQENFERYWYEKNGYEYFGDIQKNGANRAKPKSFEASSPWEIVKQIAKRHHLVLYKGLSNDALKKVV